MELTIFWTDFAKNELRSIFDYYKDISNLVIAQKIGSRLVRSVNVLSKFPKIGQKESFIKNKEFDFRYLLSGNYKIIYYHNRAQNRIEIIDIFDTRQHPQKISRNT